ncbi:MAG: RHS repeat-associated core domain-containing protein [Phycisphaerales bacterium]
MRYDYRGQPTLVEEPEAPHLALEYDNLGRVVTRSQVSDPGDPLGTMKRLERFDFSQRGAPYRARFAIDPLDEGLGHLESHRWFDATGRVVAEWEPNSPAIKAKYDAFGRVAAVYTTDRGGDAAPGEIGNHTDALDLVDDRVVSQLETRFNAVGQPDLETTRERLHDTPATGPLDDASSVAVYTGYFYDDASRPIRIAEYGTNAAGFESGGPVPTIDPLNPPTPGDPNEPAIVIGVSYDIRGLADEIIDPDGRVTKTFYDALAREIIVIENQVAVDSYTWDDFLGQWSFTGLSDNADRVTSSYYDGLDHITKVVAHLPDGAGGETTQATKFVYGVLNGDPANHTDSLVNSVDLLDRVEYPDGTSIHYAWNRLGELRAVLDQNQTTHSYLRDAAGRVVRDSIETDRQSLVDARVRAIAVEYDTLGRRAFTRSLDEFDNVLNAVGATFSAAGQLDSLYQNPFGEVQWDAQTGDPVGDTVSVDYDYAFAPVATGSGEGDHGNRLRLAGVTYPDTTTLGVKYGPSNGLNDRIGRIASLGFDSGPGAEPLDLVSYQFVGESRAAIVDYLMPEIQLDRTATREGQRRYGAWKTGTAGEYAGWDRFGRPQRLSWVDWDFTEDPLHPTVPAKPPVISRLATFDKASNILARYDDRPGARIDNRDFEFDYDDLDRLTTVRRGESDGGASWTNGKGGQSYLLDILGNWKEHATDLTGDGDFDDIGPDGDRRELRAHNEINQLTERDFTNDPALGDPTPLPFMYDANGNLWRSEINTDIDAYEYVHDAWNRLVRIEFVDENNFRYTIAEYEYNGLHWRCVKRADTAATPDGELDEVRIGYFDAQWRLLEELVDDAAVDPYAPAPNRRVQYAWGVRGLDDIIMHREDPDLDGDYDEHYYHLTDEQFSTLAIVDDTGLLNERVSYDAYGVARHHYAADFDGDGDVDLDDSDLADLAAGAWIYEANYNADADLNRDGRITYADRDLAVAMYGSSGVAALPTGALSDPDGADNRIGYAGYVFAPESHLYLARYRHYSPELGRWLEEDPLGYVDGPNLYQYVAGNPARYFDPTGLFLKKAWDLAWLIDDFLVGYGTGMWDFVKDFGGSIFHPIETVKAVFTGIRALIDTALSEGLLPALEMMFPDVAHLIRNWDCLSPEARARLMGKIAGYLSTELLTAGFAARLLNQLRGLRKAGDIEATPRADGACFAAGTLIQTANGPVPISQLQRGDKVITMNPQTGALLTSTVQELFVRSAPALLTLTITIQPSAVCAAHADLENGPTITSSIITTTPEHPFRCTESGSWVAAAELIQNDELMNACGCRTVVRDITYVADHTVAPNRVYNLSVSPTPTYLVAAPSGTSEVYLLVHNAACNPDGRRGKPPHRDRVDEVEQAFQSMNPDAEHLAGGSLPERRTRVQNDPAKYRFADLLFRLKNRIIAFQIGKKMKRRPDPIKRERDALRDLKNSDEIDDVFFFPYNDP